MKNVLTPRRKASTWLSLAVHGARLQFSIAVALISVIPSLSLLHLAGRAGWNGSRRESLPNYVG